MKKIEKRNTIGGIIVFALFVSAVLNYIPYLLVFMFAIPMMSVIVILNAIDDKSLENNTNRVILLGVILFLLSLNFYIDKIEVEKNIKESVRFCYKKNKNNSICNDIDMILNPEPIYDDE